jgi:hypothetical protein
MKTGSASRSAHIYRSAQHHCAPNARTEHREVRAARCAISAHMCWLLESRTAFQSESKSASWGVVMCTEVQAAVLRLNAEGASRMHGSRRPLPRGEMSAQCQRSSEKPRAAQVQIAPSAEADMASEQH